MHKKLAADLVSLAHSILQMKNKNDVAVLYEKALEVYEKLSVLKFVEEHVKSLPDLGKTKEEIISEIEQNLEKKAKENTALLAEEDKEVVDNSFEKIEEIEDIIVDETLQVEDKHKETSTIQTTLEDELKEAISADVATQLFENVSKEKPVVETNTVSKQRSLNDAFFNSNLQVGLNDRIAFVKHLFEGSQEDFNRVLSQLNSFKTEKEAKNFITKLVKPDYDWSTKEEYELRLLNLIERKFL